MTKNIGIIPVTVLSVQNRDRMHITGSGGGGFSYDGTGVTNSINIQTTHETKMQVWVRLPDGSEERLDFQGIDVPLRDNQRIAILGDSTSMSIWAVRNFSTGVITQIMRPEKIAGSSGSLGCLAVGLIAFFLTTPIYAGVMKLLRKMGFEMTTLSSMVLAMAGSFIGLICILSLWSWIKFERYAQGPLKKAKEDMTTSLKCLKDYPEDSNEIIHINLNA